MQQAAFPYMNAMNISGELKRIDLNIFGYASKKETLTINVHNDYVIQKIDTAKVCQLLVGKRVYIWPTMVEALVVNIRDANALYKHKEQPKSHSDVHYRQFLNDCGGKLKHQALIDAQGVDVGNVKSGDDGNHVALKK